MSSHMSTLNVPIDVEEKYSKLHEQLKRDFDFHVDRLEDKITAKNANVSELAMSKVVRVFCIFGTGLVSVVGVLAYCGFDDLRTTLIDYSSKKIDRWMSYEEVESPLMKSIADVKNQYLIDSLYIRLQRAKAEGHNSRYYALTDKEQADLIKIANSPETPLSEYSTVLTLLYGPYQFGLGKFSFDQGGAALAKVFTEEPFHDKFNKQQELLRIFSHDTSLANLAGTILTSQGPSLKEEAFQILANIGAPIAITYANENLTPEHVDEIDHRMALVLADRDIDSEMLARYITFLKGNPDSHGRWLYHMFDLFEHLHPSTDSTFETYESKKLAEKQLPMALDILAYLIETEHKFYVSDFIDRRLSFGKGNNSLVTPERYEFESLLKDNVLLNKLVTRKDDINWISSVVKAFEIRHKEQIIVSINVELSDEAALKLNSGSIIEKGDVFGDVWLTQSAEKPGLSAVFRDKSGSIQRGQLQSISNISDAKFSFKYLQKDLDLIIQYDNFL